ncbi:hypothetical protein GGH15_001257 [Coemansia sp. RSA 562]|nr:hypothetical protein LPJ69_004805 [Coemansia sp. RSA 1752]KAJ1783444.1 hypothetical protein LPJ67_004716 [Coemansia sp. RSA 1938]KAJ2168570.1 hypothetical protein GGH15_001257 [Coemansia sp. RSA 562]
MAIEDFPILAGRLRQVQTGKLEVVVDSDNLNIPKFTEIQSSIDFDKYEAANFNPALLPTGAVKPTAFLRGGFQEENIKLADICIVRLKDCGGVVLSVSIAHAVVDGYGFNLFMHRWAEINKKLVADNTATDLGVSNVVYSRSILQKAVPTPQKPCLSVLHNMYIPSSYLSRLFAWVSPGIRGTIFDSIHAFADISISCFHVSRETLDQLRQSVKKNSSTNLRISDNDVLMAAITIAYAQSILKHESERTNTGLASWLKSAFLGSSSKNPKNFVTAEAADIRHRIPNGNLENYSGNSAISMMVHSPIELLQIPASSEALTQVALGVRKSTNEITSEYIAQSIHEAESESDFVFRPLVHNTFVAERMMVTNLSRFTFYTTDFGWGIPQFVGPVNAKFPKFTWFYPAHPSKGGIYIHLNDYSNILQQMQTNSFWTEISDFVY